MASDRKKRFRSWPEGYHALSSLERAVTASALEPELLELVKLRASQLNGCAYCVDKHTQDALAAGEDTRRLFWVAVWEEAPCFTPRERATLALTDAVTLLAAGHPDDAVEAASEHFSPDELTTLLYAVIAINAWNRLAVTTGAPEPGSYTVTRDDRAD